MSANSTSIGRGPASGGNENHDADPTRKTLGETVGQEAPAGNPTSDELGSEDRLMDEVAPDVPAGVPGSKPKPGIAKGPQSYPDGPNVEASPWELDAARGKLPKP
jgi:hypothetical protein